MAAVRGQVYQTPIVDAAHAPEVQRIEFLAAARGRLLGARLLVHDAARARPHLVDRAIEQLLDFARRHIHKGLAEREHLAHAHAHELVARAVLTRAGLEVALNFLQLHVGLMCAQLRFVGRRRSRFFDGLGSFFSRRQGLSLLPALR